MKTSKIIILLATALLPASNSFAEEHINYDKETLTGDWGGKRTELANNGVEIEAIYKADVMNNVSGGIKTGTRFLDSLDVTFSIDGEKLFGSKGTSAFIDVLNNNGGRPNEDLVGTGQSIDNFEVPKATAKLYQAWVQQSMLDDKLSVLVGLYDINSEFYLMDTAAPFIQPAAGFGTDIAQSGVNGPSSFPFTSAGVRVKVQPNDNVYLLAAVLDGVSGDPGNDKGTHIEFNKNDGEFVIAETGYNFTDGKIGVGGWYYTEKLIDQVTSNPERSSGYYIIGETNIYKESENQGLNIFGHLGFADENTNQFDYSWVAGLVYTGAFEGRDEDKLGISFAGAHNGDSFKQASAIALTPVDSAETQIDLTYSAKITPWLSIQPDAQYVINPGTDKSLDNALVLTTRAVVSF